MDIVVDAIDSVIAKVKILAYLYHKHPNIKIVSSMGAGFRKDPRFIKTADIWKTHGCGLAKAVRNNLKKLNVGKGIMCVYSDEDTKNINKNNETEIGSLVTITSIFGLYLAQLALEKTKEGEEYGNESIGKR